MKFSSLCAQIGAFVLTALMTVSLAFADTAVLTWTPNTESDLMGYKIYQSTTPGVYTTPAIVIGPVVNPPTTQTVNLPNLSTNQTYYWVVTAYDVAGNESGKSNEVSKVVLAAKTSISVNPTAFSLVIPTGATSIAGSVVVTNTGNVPVTVNWADSTSCLQGLVGLTRTIAVGGNTTFTINGVCPATGTITLSGTGFTSVVIPVTIVKAVIDLAPAAPQNLLLK